MISIKTADNFTQFGELIDDVESVSDTYTCREKAKVYHLVKHFATKDETVGFLVNGKYDAGIHVKRKKIWIKICIKTTLDLLLILNYSNLRN